MTVEIRRHLPGNIPGAFIEFPSVLYTGDTGWTPPLRSEARKHLTPGKNPYFAHAEVMFFTAWKGDTLVGRCSAQIDNEYLRIHQDKIGFFGCFDTIDCPGTASALLNAASNWCAERGMDRIKGPFTLGINEELGVMIEGFDQPSVMMTPYHRPHQARLVEGAGFSKAKDILSWRYQCGALPVRAQKAYEMTMALPEVRIRPINKRKLDEEMSIVRDVFNDAWSGNWGYVPWTDAEFAKAVEEFRMILEPRMALIAEIDGEPVGIAVCLPNLNEAIRDMDGRLGPIHLAKLLWRIKANTPKSAKLPLLGLRKSIQKKRRYAGLAAAMCAHISHQLNALGISWVELGWTLEDNHAVNAVIKRMGATPMKRHRIFEKTL